MPCSMKCIGDSASTYAAKADLGGKRGTAQFLIFN